VTDPCSVAAPELWREAPQAATSVTVGSSASTATAAARLVRRDPDIRGLWRGPADGRANGLVAAGSGHQTHMAHNEIRMFVPPERVFAVLSDPRSFARWVVGSKFVRRADPDWPAAGTAFDHSVGFGPLVLSDHSEVLECTRPHLLRLLVKARPFSQAVVTLRLQAAATGTLVSMEEHAADRRSRLLFNPLTDPLVRLRNAESLRRLKALAEGTEPMPTGHLPPRDAGVDGRVTAPSAPARA
jgi:uncharacterized protein YndB with AHSA1/START domain